LLLEGDDLEALLARARAEGGPHARIVRAEKLRQGGVLGFFAKEKFEVALEVPDEFRTPAPQEEPMSQPTPAPTLAAPEGPAAGGALDRFTRRLTAAAEDPEVAAREGLLGLAQRADAVELAAARPAQPAVPDALDLALRKLLDPETAAPANRPEFAALLEPAGALAATTGGSPVHPSTSRPEFTALLDELLVPTRAPEAPVAVVPGPRPNESASSSWGSSQAPQPGASSVPPAYREVSLPPAAPAYSQAPAAQPAAVQPAASQSAPTPPPAALAPAHPVGRHTLGRTTRPGEGTQNRDRREDPQLAADRSALRALGVPTAWTRQLRPGDRFTAVLRMLDRMPEVDFDPATRVVAVVGPASSVLLEAHRTALDLPTDTATGPGPRPVVHVPAAAGAERATALAEARLLGDVVVAIEANPADTDRAVEALQVIGAGAVLAIVQADAGLERAQAFLDALGQVDALAVEGTGASAEPAAVLQLGLPVVRLDGIPIDRYTWTAVLCAQLGPAPAR
jgi:hypothetical protein